MPSTDESANLMNKLWWLNYEFSIIVSLFIMQGDDSIFPIKWVRCTHEQCWCVIDNAASSELLRHSCKSKINWIRKCNFMQSWTFRNCDKNESEMEITLGLLIVASVGGKNLSPCDTFRLVSQFSVNALILQWCFTNPFRVLWAPIQ